MAKIYLSHSTQFDNVGAGDYGTEASEMIPLTDRIAYHLRRQPASYGFEVRVNSPKMTLAQTIADSNAWGADIHQANHTNAGGSKGTEVEAYGPGTNSDRLAQCIYRRVAPISPGNPDRGVKIVYGEDGTTIGRLDPRETASPLYRKNGKLHVVYNTISKGANSKSGYVAYNDGFSKF
jgi:N-acetylmuramoyl-L-alanine amidase